MTDITDDLFKILLGQLNRLAQTGRYDWITIEEILEHLEDGSILTWIKEQGGEDIDLSTLFEPEHDIFRVAMVEGLLTLLHNEHEEGRRTWDSEDKRGIVLLISWTSELSLMFSGPNDMPA